MYTRVRDIFNRPIASVPGAQFELTERMSDDYNWTYRYVHIKRISVSTALVFSSYEDTRAKQSVLLISVHTIIWVLLNARVNVQLMLLMD